MKYLYLVDYWVPFPASEYGGIISVIAENDDECFDILTHSTKEINEIDMEKYQHLIPPKVATAQRFKLADTDVESGVIDAFTT